MAHTLGMKTGMNQLERKKKQPINHNLVARAKGGRKQVSE